MPNLTGSALFAQSGGPTSVINTSAYGVIAACLSAPEIDRVFAAKHGVRGILDDNLIEIGEELQARLPLLKNTPSAAFGSCRHKLKNPEEDVREYKIIEDVFRKHNIRYFFLNGGNDSMDTCAKISRYFETSGYECRVIGVPKTIDNDLVLTDHCPGFPSAAKFIATVTAECALDNSVYDTGSVAIIEAMGRHAGWLAGSAALAAFAVPGIADFRSSPTAPDLIYLPERVFNVEEFLSAVAEVYKRKSKCLVVVSEGLTLADGTFVSEAQVSGTDGFAHAQLGGLAARLAAIVKERLGVKTRGIELSLLQRCASHSASGVDITEAEGAGRFAVVAAIAGHTGKMAGILREPPRHVCEDGVCYTDSSYQSSFSLFDVADVANAEKKVPPEMITEDGTYVTQEFIDYCLPLIAGEPERVYNSGVPEFFTL
ncbi:MAG: 6-phosphofructokinase [Oscillospiraceae bacterium]|jgi:6-phosphofructokinase 1|nr:6-phosphofructokinase [Oscillospiraceae bacterium]